MTPGAAGGVRTVPDAVHHTRHHGGECQGPRDQEDGAGASAGLARHLVGDEKPETEACGSLGQSDRPAHREIFRKFVEGKLCHDSHHYSSRGLQATGNRQKRVPCPALHPAPGSCVIAG